MTRGADELPVSDHAVLRYLQRVCGVDIDAVRRRIDAATARARAEGARGVRADGVVYRLKSGYVATCFAGEEPGAKGQHLRAAKKILRKSRHVPILTEE